MLQTFLSSAWNEGFTDETKQKAINCLENGQILHFTQLDFKLEPEENIFLSPQFAHPHSKNIGYQLDRNKLWGVQQLSDAQHTQFKRMLKRFCQHSFDLVKNLFPNYASNLIVARTSYRPVQICGRKTSPRKDDKRLHVDAFPSAPNQGKRILRVFTNINPHGEDRVWRVGESFDNVVQTFLPKCRKPFPGLSSLLRLAKITKSFRTLYDHYMLELHDRMKEDDDYQARVQQQEIRFQPGSSWIVQTDDVSHAAMTGQYALEQTFYLPVEAMQDQSKSPLRILEKRLNKNLI